MDFWREEDTITMKKSLVLGSIFAICLGFGHLAAAEEASQNEKDLGTAAASVDQAGSQGEGQKMVLSRLETTFNVDAARIDSLRSQKLGYGEIATVLALAQNMSGGITDDNVNSILAMRTGPPHMGWGEIARSLGEKLGAVISKVNEVAKGSHEGIEKPERASRPEKPEKPERPEKPEKPAKP